MKFIDKIKKSKLLYFLGVLIVGIFIVLIVRFTYAYLALNVNEARGDVTLNSDETDKLDFAVGDPLSIDATPTTLPENGENLVDTTTAKATLLANSTNTTAEYPYWVYFTISNNTFVYSDGSSPEIILTVTDPEGNPVTNIDGLTYGTFNGVAGFDVTTQNGTFTVANGYTITSNSSTTATEQTWTFTLTYLNQIYDQSINFGNSMTTEVSMSKEENVVTLANYITNTVYTGTDGDNGLYYHDGVGSYTNANLEAGDNSYRYAGANPNNYVCFGSDEQVCPNENLYRIIGVFDEQVKLIKNVNVGSYAWDRDNVNFDSISNISNTYENYIIVKLGDIIAAPDPVGSNDWTNADLNYYINNDYYFNTLDSYWQNFIAKTIWQVGGVAYENVYNSPVQTAYNYEVGPNAANTTYQAQVGLMYVSDYGYAASPDSWATELNNYNNVANNNWLYLGNYEWTITRNSNDTKMTFTIDTDGRIAFNGYISADAYVRPVFYLKDNAQYVSGTGTASDPYRIA